MMQQYKPLFRFILALAVVAIGVTHFTSPDSHIRIVPSVLPHPLALVYGSGVIEILAGIGLLIPRVRHAAAWVLVVLFIAIFPANLNQAIHNIPVSAMPHDPPLIWLRLPFQVCLVLWAWWLTRADGAVETIGAIEPDSDAPKIIPGSKVNSNER